MDLKQYREEEDCNQEVLRVLKKMPAWVPKSNRNKVSVYYILPVSFARAGWNYVINM